MYNIHIASLMTHMILIKDVSAADFPVHDCYWMLSRYHHGHSHITKIL